MELDDFPQLESPNVIAAFHGWNDAGQAATTALRYLIDAWDAKPFARLSADDYFSYTDTRPTIRIVDGTQRELVWPKIELWWASGAGLRPDSVLLMGPEPNLRWQSFCDEVIGLAESMNARRIVTMGSLVTDAVHTRPVPLTGFSNDPDVQSHFAARGVTRSNYEGPTGIVGTLNTICRERDLPAASLWAAAPFYLGSTPNPKTALGLLTALDEALALKLDLRELQGVADEFERQVSLAVRDNSEVQEQIRTLEQRYDAREVAAPSSTPEFPPTGAIIADLEDFLREQREDE